LCEVKLQKWEYKVVIFAGKRESWEPQLNELGSEGWEAVSASASSGVVVLLKRPIN